MVNSYWSEFFSDVSENMTKPVALVLGNHDTLIGGLHHLGITSTVLTESE